MDQGWQRKKSWSRSVEKEKKDKDKKKKKKHHEDRDRSRSHHKKKKKHSSPERVEKERSKQPQVAQNQAKQSKMNKQIEASPMKDAREKSEKKKKEKQSRESEHKKKKKKEKKEKRDYSRDSRSRSREKKKKRDYRDDRDYKRRDDYYRRDKRKRSYDRRDNFRYDSPPKHSDSEIKQDPQQLQKLSQLKAAKELVSSKADRKLYLGNLPPNITSQQLMEMLNSALKKMDINTDVEGDSIVSAWISPDGVGHYAFVQFRTAQEATNGLTLNGASLFGYQLKLGRPKQYIEYNKALLSQMGTDKNMDTIILKVASLGKQELPPVEQRIIAPPSKIVVLKHIVSIEELGIDEQYNEILEDVKDMAKRFGQVVDIHIPRPHLIIDLQSVPKRVKGLGLIFIEYKSVADAKVARAKLVQKQFSGRPVACCFFDEKKYREGEYDIQDKVIIDF